MTADRHPPSCGVHFATRTCDCAVAVVQRLMAELATERRRCSDLAREFGEMSVALAKERDDAATLTHALVLTAGPTAPLAPDITVGFQETDAADASYRRALADATTDLARALDDNTIVTGGTIEGNAFVAALIERDARVGERARAEAFEETADLVRPLSMDLSTQIRELAFELELAAKNRAVAKATP